MLISVAFAVAIGNLSQRVSASAGEEESEMGNDQIEPMSPAITTRSVLVELFTGTWCPPCQAAEGALDRLADEYTRSQLSILEWHLSDSFSPLDGSESIRQSYYQAGTFYVPAAFFDGQDHRIGGSTDPDSVTVYNDYKSRIDAALTNPSPLTITVTGALDDPMMGQATVRANITAIDNIMTPNLHARFVVYEDDNYTFFIGSPTREYRLRHTVVATLPEDPITIMKEQTISYTKTFNIDPAWDRNKLGVVVFVQTDDKIQMPYSDTFYNWAEILQATSLNFTSAKVDLTLTSDDISFSDPTPGDGDLVTIYATVHNKGNLGTMMPVKVRFFDGDPSAGGTKIGSDYDAGFMMSDGSANAQVIWDTTGKQGTHEIVVVVDPDNNISEPENENNNIAPKTIDVGPPVLAPPYALIWTPLGTGIPVDTNFTVQWSEVMDWDTVNASFSFTDSVTIWDQADGTFSHDSVARTSAFDPNFDLEFAKTYFVTFDTTATDATAEPLDQDQDGTGGEVGQDELSWQFSTINNPPEARSLLVDSYADGTPGILHILSANPAFDWLYYDIEMAAQTDYEVRVGTTSGNNDMWAPGPAGGPGLSEVYAGLPLTECTDYYFGVQVMDDIEWGLWNETMFHTNCVPPAPTTPIWPLDGGITPSSASTTVSWTSGGADGDGDTITYYWEVATDNTFIAIVASGSTSATTSDPFTTNPATTYYWRTNTTDTWEFSEYGNMPTGYWYFDATAPNDPPEAHTLLVDTYADGTPGILHILSTNPTFDWSYFDTEMAAQTDYEVHVGTTSGDNDMWAPGPAGAPGLTEVYAGLALTDCTDYYFGVRVMDDMQWGLWNETMFHTNCIPPAPTTPITPLNGSDIPSSSATTVSWTSGGADSDGDVITYYWQVSMDNFATIIFSASTDTTTSNPFPTNPTTTYYWRVSATDSWESSEYGNMPLGYWMFNTTTPNDPPEARSLLVDSYADGTPGIMHILSADPMFEWNYYDPEMVIQIDYEVRVGTTPGGNDMWAPGPAGGPGVSEIYAGLPLADATDYYFSVRVMDDLQWSPWNETLFHTNGVPPSPTTPINPAHLDTTVIASSSTTVSWTAGGVDPEGDPITYMWQVATDSGFVSLIASGTATAPSSSVFTTVSGTTYYWHATACDNWGECSLWSTTWEFTTVDELPTIDLWQPGSTPSESYVQGEIISVVWTANDDNALVDSINVTYGSPLFWIPIATNEPNDGLYGWDTTFVPCDNSYWMNVTVYDSIGQEAYDVTDFDFEITCPVTVGDITGTVKDENGDPIVGATVTLTDSTGAPVGTKQSDSSGNFGFPGVDEGVDEYTITAEKDYYITTTQEDVDVDAGDTTHVDLILDTNGTITGKVVDEDGNPVEGATVKLIDASGNVVGISITDSDGNYNFWGFDYGDYTIQIEASGYDSGSAGPAAVNKNNLYIPLPDAVLTSPAHPITPEGDFLSDYWWILIVLAVIVAVIILVLVLAKRRKPEEEAIPEEPKVEEAPVAAEAVAAPEAFVLACAKCGGEVESGYKICPHCGESLEAEEVEEAEAPATKACINCGEALEAEYLVCPHCGTKQDVEEAKEPEVAVPIVCKTCGEALEPEYLLCPNCGTKR